MAASNPFQRELCAVALLGAGVFLGVSLATYSPSDPVSGSLGPLAAVYRPDVVEYPAPEEIGNSCGRWGALAADLLLNGIGAGAYYAVGSILVLSGFLFLRAGLEGPLFRFAGWLGSLVGVATLAALLLPEWSPGPMVGAGGYLGALGAGLLLHHFAMFGSLLLAGSFVIGGLLMCSDQVFPAMLRWSLGGFLAPLLKRREPTTVARVDAGGRPIRTPNKSPPVKIAPTKSRRERAAAAAAAEADAAVATGVGATAASGAFPTSAGGAGKTGNGAGPRADDDSSPSILPIRGRGKHNVPAAEVADGDEDAFDPEIADEARGETHAAGKPTSSKSTTGKNAAGRGASSVMGGPAARTAGRNTSASSTSASSVSASSAVASPAAKTPAAADRMAAHEDDDEAEQTANASGAGNASGPHFKSRSSHDARAAVLAELQEDGRDAAVDDYQLPGIDLLVAGEDVDWESQEKEVRRKAKVLEKTFADFGFQVRVVEIETGPVIAQYEVELEAGLRLSKITALADDLAIALRVPSVRIVAPIPGKNTVGIEVPNEERQVVRLREVIEETNGKIKKMRIPLFLGKDVSGNPLAVDLSTLPHLLIAGRTGTGKSVCLNAIISSILMTRRPDEVRMIMIDPKMVELSGYGRLPHLMHPVVTDMKKAEAILAWGVEKMEERYALLARAGVRHISNYNQLGEEELRHRLQPEDDAAWSSIPKQLPFIVIVADEIADMMMTAGKEVEQHIIRLAQKSRAVGIHLILATQKPTVDVITGLIKSNLPARISFQVASRVDSRVVLDEMGADKLLGNGDMLFLWPGTSTLLRGQGTYLGDDEITRLVDCCSRGRAQNFVSELVNMKVESDGEGDGGLMEKLRKRDELYESAVDVVIREGRGSCSLLQRALGIGYGRAARLIDFMAEDGIVGTYAGSQAREVLMTVEQWEQLQNESPGGGSDSGGTRHEGGATGGTGPLAGPLASQRSGAAGASGPVGGGARGATNAGSPLTVAESRRTARGAESALSANTSAAGVLSTASLHGAAAPAHSPAMPGAGLAATGTTGPVPSALPKMAPGLASREPGRASTMTLEPPGVAFAPPSALDDCLPDAPGGYGAGDTYAAMPAAGIAPAFAPEAGIPPRVPLAGNLPPSVALASVRGPADSHRSDHRHALHLEDGPQIDEAFEEELEQLTDRDASPPTPITIASSAAPTETAPVDPNSADPADPELKATATRTLSAGTRGPAGAAGTASTETAATATAAAMGTAATAATTATTATAAVTASAPEQRGRASATRRGVITFPRLVNPDAIDDDPDEDRPTP